MTPTSAIPSTDQAPTTQRLNSLLKSCRQIMRKDKGLNGDLDRLPMLTWIMFLKFLDDAERIRRDEATMEGEPYRPLLEKPYRWRDWNRPTSEEDDGLHNAMTGDALTAFINHDEAVRPDGTRGRGLFAYLRSLQDSGRARGRRREVVATVFRGLTNRMQSGYLLRDVLDKVNEIHLWSSQETHTLSHLYESLLKEMRDAAGDAGEFYTPRPLVRVIVQATDPRLGETVLDPAAGTGGFLVEAYEHMRRSCRTVQEREVLQRRTLLGIEAKPLPYLLCQMNMLLHGLEAPDVALENALSRKVTEIGDRERVDVIMTNPPFGGEEEKGIQRNFPADMQTSETALLFLQLIMRKLRRFPQAGRAAVVVPNGFLVSSGVGDRVKAQLLREFNLHTVLRLPQGAFEPYTDIPTNVLFFDRNAPTETTWYYEHPLPPGRKKYTKTFPLRFEEFAPFLAWWERRQPTANAWTVPAEQLLPTGKGGARINLDLRNPRAAAEASAPTVADLLAEMAQLNARIRRGIEELVSLTGKR